VKVTGCWIETIISERWRRVLGINRWFLKASLCMKLPWSMMWERKDCVVGAGDYSSHPTRPVNPINPIFLKVLSYILAICPIKPIFWQFKCEIAQARWYFYQYYWVNRITYWSQGVASLSRKCQLNLFNISYVPL